MNELGDVIPLSHYQEMPYAITPPETAPVMVLPVDGKDRDEDSLPHFIRLELCFSTISVARRRQRVCLFLGTTFSLCILFFNTLLI